MFCPWAWACATPSISPCEFLSSFTTVMKKANVGSKKRHHKLLKYQLSDAVVPEPVTAAAQYQASVNNVAMRRRVSLVNISWLLITHVRSCREHRRTPTVNIFLRRGFPFSQSQDYSGGCKQAYLLHHIVALSGGGNCTSA